MLPLAAAFRKGLGQNVTVEYYWLEGQFDRLPTLMADLARRRVAVIATPAGNAAALAAKAATTTIPIVFGVSEDPVKLGLVASLRRPGGNLTGINFFATEFDAKRLALLHELVPKAIRIAVLVNPVNVPATESTLRAIPEAARAIGLQIEVLNASTSREIEAAFGSLVRDGADALYVAGEGAKPADLPVEQPTKFDLVVNLIVEGARPRRAADSARPRRRGDRVSAPGKAGAIQPVEDRPK